MSAERRIAPHAMLWFARESRQSIAPRNIAITALAAGTVSGLPSTAWAAATGHSVFEAARAAGTLIPGRRLRPSLVAGCAVHVAVSVFWTQVIATASQGRASRQLSPLEGAGAGLLIAALDLAVIGRRYPAIRALPAVPQWCDHVAFGVAVTAWLPAAPTHLAVEPLVRRRKPGQRRRRYPAK